MQVMRGDIRGHPHGDPRRSIGQQMRESGGHHDRLFQRAIVIRTEIDRVFRKPLHQLFGNRRQARFGVARGRRVIPVDIAKIALTIDQRVADVEILREPGHRVINRGIAMRVVVAHHVAGNFCRFTEPSGGGKLQLSHRVKNAAVNRLQPVTRIRQGPVHDR